MFVQRICVVLGIFGSISANDAEYEAICADNYDNEIPDQQQESPSMGPCQEDGPRWDKLFTALEDSHMRQNMLLSSLEQNCGGGGSLKTLWDKLTNRGGCHVCLPNVEKICKALAEQTDLKIHAQFVEMTNYNAETERSFNLTLQQVLHRIQEVNTRLKRLEDGSRVTSSSAPAVKADTTRPESGVREQEAGDRWSGEEGSVGKALVAIATELQRIQVHLQEVIKETRNKGRGDT